MFPAFSPAAETDRTPSSVAKPPPVVVTAEMEETGEEDIGTTEAPEARTIVPPGTVIVPVFATFVPTRATVPPG
jgi:hypothetical protein